MKKAAAGAVPVTPPPAPERLAQLPPKSDVRWVHAIARRHFGESPKRIGAHGGGLSNAVFGFRVSSGDFIVRTHRDATRIAGYLKEQWAIEAARAAGVPVPRVLEVGNFADGRAYMILEQVHGINGCNAPNRLATLEALGRAGALLQAVRTRGWGPVFDWSSNRLSGHGSWADYLQQGYGVEQRLAVLQRHRMITAQQAGRLRATARRLAAIRHRPVLQHGDLRLKNALVDPVDGRLLALIDWETCTSSPGPYWDLSLALHELGIDEKEALLAGYGITARGWAAALPFVRFFNTLNYTHAVQDAAKRRDAARLAWFRLRLQGALDVYEPA